MNNWKHFNPKFEYEEAFRDSETPWGGHKIFVYDLVRNIKPALIVELGTYKGTSLMSMCQAIKDDAEIKTNIVGIDSWEGDLNTGSYSGDLIYSELGETLKTYYSETNYELKRMLFENALDSFKDGSIDLLHIDGLHTYEAVKADYETWLPKMATNGIILFHDVKVQKENFGVDRFWNEAKDSFVDSFNFDHSNGLGVAFLSKHNFKLDMDFKYYYLFKSYEALKYDLYKTRYAERELNDIKNSKFWKSKEKFKKLIGKN